ncbi:MAG TPA: PEP-CTERM sorting domain-containing protein [Burkholderiaceae bacterium]
MTPHSITPSSATRTALACVALFGAGQTMAQTITGTITSIAGDAYSVSANITNLTFAQGGSAAYGGAGVVFCIEPSAAFPERPSTHTYDVVDAASVINAPASFAGRTEALVNWVVDQYYASFINQSITSYSFNQMLWELTGDYDGTLASLSSTAGTTRTVASLGPQFPTMLDELKGAYGSIDDAYRSASFSVRFLVDQDGAYQDMALVTPVPAVPEPSTYLMLFGGIGALMVWRRRQAQR